MSNNQAPRCFLMINMKLILQDIYSKSIILDSIKINIGDFLICKFKEIFYNIINQKQIN